MSFELWSCFLCLYFLSLFALFVFRETLKEVLPMLRSTGNPQVEYIIRIMKKWAKDNRVALWTHCMSYSWTCILICFVWYPYACLSVNNICEEYNSSDASWNKISCSYKATISTATLKHLLNVYYISFFNICSCQKEKTIFTMYPCQWMFSVRWTMQQIKFIYFHTWGNIRLYCFVLVTINVFI